MFVSICPTSTPPRVRPSFPSRRGRHDDDDDDDDGRNRRRARERANERESRGGERERERERRAMMVSARGVAVAANAVATTTTSGSRGGRWRASVVSTRRGGLGRASGTAMREGRGERFVSNVAVGRRAETARGAATVKTKAAAGGSGGQAEALRALLEAAAENLSGGEDVVRSVEDARALIERTRAERKRKEVMAPTSARLATLEREASELREQVRRLKSENQEAIDALLAEAAALAEQTTRMEEIEGELEDARQLNKRLVSAAQELAALVDDSSTVALEAELAAKDAEIVALKATVEEIEHKLADRDELLAIIRDLEIELADSVTSAELDALSDGKLNSPGVILALEAENKEMRARIASLQASGEERDSLLKRIRELEVTMSDMEEAEVYLQAKKEAESAKMDNVDLSTLVESLTAKLAEQTKIAQKAKDVTDEALANVRALEGDMAYMDYAPGISSAMKAAKQMENAAERAAEIAAGLQQLEVGMTKKSTVRKVPFKRGGEKFSLRKKIFNSAERGDKGNKGFTRAPADAFTLRKLDFTKIKAQSATNKIPFKRAPESSFKLRKMTFPFSSRTASVPASVFKRTGNFELRRFIFTSDPVDVRASASFERNGEFTLRKLQFPPSSRGKDDAPSKKVRRSGTVFKFF